MVNESVQKILNHPMTVPAAVGVVSLAAGVGIGYILGRKQLVEVEVYEEEAAPNPQLQLQFDVKEAIRTVEQAQDEVQDIREAVEAMRVKRLTDISEEVDVAEETDEPDEELPQEVVVEAEEISPVEETVRQSVFGANGSNWDYDAEVKHRTPTTPYILHKDEFYADEMDLSQMTLTYFAGDDTMVDEEERPVYNYNDVVGPLRFGHGSDDENVLYVRNEARRAEYEILFDPGHYAVEILGLEMEHEEAVKDLKHSAIPKFRQE